MHWGGRKLQRGFSSILNQELNEECVLGGSTLQKGTLLKHDAISFPRSLASSCVRFLLGPMENEPLQPRTFGNQKKYNIWHHNHTKTYGKQHLSSPNIPNPEENQRKIIFCSHILGEMLGFPIGFIKCSDMKQTKKNK